MNVPRSCFKDKSKKKSVEIYPEILALSLVMVHAVPSVIAAGVQTEISAGFSSDLS